MCINLNKIFAIHIIKETDSIMMVEDEILLNNFVFYIRNHNCYIDKKLIMYDIHGFGI
jgi:hypothetical protein